MPPVTRMRSKHKIVYIYNQYTTKQLIPFLYLYNALYITYIYYIGVVINATWEEWNGLLRVISGAVLCGWVLFRVAVCGQDLGMVRLHVQSHRLLTANPQLPLQPPRPHPHPPMPLTHVNSPKCPLGGGGGEESLFYLMTPLEQIDFHIINY